jgi:hypothetical protein
MPIHVLRPLERLPSDWILALSVGFDAVLTGLKSNSLKELDQGLSEGFPGCWTRVLSQFRALNMKEITGSEDCAQNGSLLTRREAFSPRIRTLLSGYFRMEPDRQEKSHQSVRP